MSIYNNLVNPCEIALFEKKREHYLNLTNSMYSKAVKRQYLFVESFNKELLSILGENYSSYISGSSIYISNKLVDPSGISKEIASIDLRANKIQFRRKGAPMVSKIIKCAREITPIRAANYAIRFGTK